MSVGTEVCFFNMTLQSRKSAFHPKALVCNRLSCAEADSCCFASKPDIDKQL